MRTINPPRVQLSFNTEAECVAAETMADAMLRALNTHADVYLQEPLTRSKHDVQTAVSLAFAAASPLPPLYMPRRVLQPAGLDVAIVGESVPAAEHAVARAAPPVNTHIMLDLETLGTKPGCQVLSVGAVEFGPSGPGKTFYAVFEVETQRAAGLVADASTVAWWEKQSPEARAVLTDEKNKTATIEGLKDLTAWLRLLAPRKQLRLWGNGADFDNPILAATFAAFETSLPWEWYNNRCYRTLKNLRKDITLGDRQGTYHNALDDAKTQAEHAVRILNSLNCWATV
jgi:3' exoribonuclease, RNase T-like